MVSCWTDRPNDARDGCYERPSEQPNKRPKLVFWLPLVGYWALAILIVFYPQPPWVVVILGSPLVLVAFRINSRHFNREAR